MNARTLVITAGAIVALAAPALATAKLSPADQYQKQLAAKKHAAKQAVKVFKRQGQSRQIYIYTYVPAPIISSSTPPAASQPTSDDCEYTSNCSAEQLCLISGLNCNLVTPSPTGDPSLTAPAQVTYNDSAGT
jgi:hypothetical protein